MESRRGRLIQPASMANATRYELSAKASAASQEGAGTMSNGWTPKVADFGLARTTETQDITVTGELLARIIQSCRI